MTVEISINSILGEQVKQLNLLYSGFSTIMATGYNYEESMKYVLIGLENTWELLSYAFEEAFMITDGDNVHPKYRSGWHALEHMEQLIRRCLLIDDVNIEKATSLLQMLGVLVAESERCASLWLDKTS